ncbi:MAG TPA: ACP synthase [Lentisphaeria bacterium]|nr:MAG: holo-[acyl-carrier-protein] synthase [Lentisphaerae bacterium GWF2_38_69]HBM16015.1 ACP synthase [Lentisphaeria bacterium]
MIFGIGIDIVSIKRIRRAEKIHGDKFIKRVYTDSEIDESKKLSNASHYFAGRWAAKEAVSKALKTGITSDCGWKDIEIYNEKNGSPSCRLSGKALNTAKKLGMTNILVSISHERKNICALAVLEINNKK